MKFEPGTKIRSKEFPDTYERTVLASFEVDNDGYDIFYSLKKHSGLTHHNGMSKYFVEMPQIFEVGKKYRNRIYPEYVFTVVSRRDDIGEAIGWITRVTGIDTGCSKMDDDRQYYEEI